MVVLGGGLEVRSALLTLRVIGFPSTKLDEVGGIGPLTQDGDPPPYPNDRVE
jgi:hypothetical protein